MMMAHDSSPGPSALDALTISSVREALVQYIDVPTQSNGLRHALNRMALEAHEKSMLPEQLLVVLKGIWYNLPSVHTISDPAEQIRLLQRVVTMCIREYYAD